MADNSEQGSLLGKIAAYTELLDKDPRSTIFVPLSEAYRQMEMLDEAVEIAQKGIMENPAFPSGYVIYGRALAQQGLVDKAAAEFDKALTLDRKNLEALKALAEIRLQQGAREEARKLLEQAHSIKSDDASVLKMLSGLEKPQAVASADVSSEPVTVGAASEPKAPLDNSGEPISTATIAEIYIRQGFPEKALKVYRDLLRADPQNDQLRHKLIALKERLSADGAEDEMAEVIGASDVTVPEASLQDAIPAVVWSESIDSVPDSTVASDERTLVEIFSGWIDAISRRREAHVR